MSWVLSATDQQEAEVAVFEPRPSSSEELPFQLLIELHEATKRLAGVLRHWEVQVDGAAVGRPDGSD